MSKHKQFINSLSKTITNKKVILILVFFVTLLLPFITNFLVTHLNLEDEYRNEYVGFFGNYLGSIVTIVGVWLTIRFTTKEENENRRLQIIPYIETSFTESELTIGQNPDREKELRIEVGDWENQNKRITGHLKLQNVGLGSAIDVKIHDVFFENQPFLNVPVINVLKQDGDTSIGVEISLVLPDTLRKTIAELKSQSKELHMKLSYKDLLGNTYIQKLSIICSIVVFYGLDDIITALDVNTYLRHEGQPQLVHK
ncbi:hypothetical protein [Bacillus rhizoplanae]|uniref:hypothetical protein n=1 Tax=Bacillus rhizoplanae TaxID=2880966 RepID=UPI003D1A14AC